MQKVKTHELRNRLLFTILILLIYMFGRSLLLFQIDAAAYELSDLNSENVVLSMISGDRYRYTIFALGIMPYFTGSLLVQIIFALLGSDFRSKFSPRKMQRITLSVVIVVTIAYAVSRVGDLIFLESDIDVRWLRGIAVLEMTIGALTIYKLADWNKKYGIAAQTPLIFVNILDNLASTVQIHNLQEMRKVLILCLIMAAIALVMENTLIKMPVQRVSIHSEYADKSYIAFKLNPIGVMPVMFASAFFILPQLIVRLLLYLVKSPMLKQLNGRINLNDPVGIRVYMATIFTITILFSFILLSPGNMAEQLQRGGDSIVGIYAGKKTRWYLRRKLLVLSVISGTVLGLLMGVSLFYSLNGGVASELAMLPSTAMIMVSLMCNLAQEIATYWRFDSYSFFM